MDAADPACGDEADARQRGRPERACNRRGTRCAHGHCWPQVSGAQLSDLDGRIRQALQVGWAEADPQLAVEDRDRGRDGAGSPDGPLTAEGRLQVARVGQAMSDYRRLQSDHGAAGGESLLHLQSKARAHGRAPRSVTAPAPTSTARPAASSGVAPSR